MDITRYGNTASVEAMLRARCAVKAVPSVKMPKPVYIHTFDGATGDYTKVGSTSAELTSITDTDYIRAGTKSIKVRGLNASANKTIGAFRALGTSVDLKGKAIRVRYFIHYANSAVDITKNQLNLGVTPDASYSANYGRINLPANPGWNTVEVDAGNIWYLGGTFDPDVDATIQGFTFNFGFASPTSTDYAAWENDYIVLDLFEIWDTGATTGHVCIQFDDAFEEQFSEMIPYCAQYGIPTMVYASPEVLGTIDGGFQMGSWDQLIHASRHENVLIGTHSKSFNLPDTHSNAALEDWICKQKSYLLDRGLIRGVDYFALPGGQSASLRDEEALRIYQKYFVHIRGTSQYYQEDKVTGAYGGEGKVDGSYPLVPREYSWGTAIQIVTDSGSDSWWSTRLDQCIARKCFVSFYAHGLTEVNALWPTSRAGFRAFIDAVATAVAAGTLKVCTYEDVVNGKVPIA